MSLYTNICIAGIAGIAMVVGVGSIVIGIVSIIDVVSSHDVEVGASDVPGVTRSDIAIMMRLG